MLHDYSAFAALPAEPFASLSEADGLIRFSGLTINLLPLLMTLLNLLSAYYYAQNPKEKRTIWVFPLLFLLLLYQQPAALVFYWTINNALSLFKNLFQAKKRGISLAISELTQLCSRRKLGIFGETGRALHVSLFLFALFLAILYFVDNEKDKPLPILWMNSSLLLLLYLGLYYNLFFGYKTNRLKPRFSVRFALSVFLLMVSLGLSLRILMVNIELRGFTGGVSQALILEQSAQSLRPLAWLLAFAAIVLRFISFGFAKLSCDALLWPQNLPIGYHFRVWWRKSLTPATQTRPVSRFSMKSSVHFLPRYVLGIANILLAMFYVVPSRIFASDPSTFEGNDNLRVVLQLSIFVFLGITLAALAYLLLPKILRYYASLLAAVATWFFSANVLLFPGDYGPMEFTSFRRPLEISTNSVAASVVLLGALLLVLLPIYLLGQHQAPKWPKKLDQTLYLILGLHAFAIFGSLYQIARFHNDLGRTLRKGAPFARAASRNVETAPKTENPEPSKPRSIPLSQTERNVLILVLDKFMGGFVPDILQADPSLAKRLDGFIYYPNAVSQAQRTYGALHPIVGGSDYTVEKMNANKHSLAADIMKPLP